MRLASLEALHLTGHGVSSGDPREMDMRLEETIYNIFLCVFLCPALLPTTVVILINASKTQNITNQEAQKS